MNNCNGYMYCKFTYIESGYCTHQSLTEATNACSCTSSWCGVNWCHMWWSTGALSGASPSCTQYGATALLLAAYGGSVELARMLLDECGSTVDKVNNVSVMFTTLPGAVGGVVRTVPVLCQLSV